MDILQQIAGVKRQEVAAKKAAISPEAMKAMAEAVDRPVNPMAASIAGQRVAIIAEHKRRSPSKGELSPMSRVAEVARGYAAGGAAAMSVLTDTPFFGGSLDDLAVARAAAPGLPLLRKEFIVDEYQIYEARVYGADAILLIASLLDAYEMARLSVEAHRLGLQTLVEVHTAEEIARVPEGAEMVGVNNRNLSTFATSVTAGLELIEHLPAGALKIAESGIKGADDLTRLHKAGFDGFLIGEALMATASPTDALVDLIKESESTL
ncbi:MAG: indole-3-glycerol phosphate synthase TrpC [Pseudoflavonifractor sp.]|nr:indole-3-glycerol phosphate synthase TrpC [Alloprevotella sp.]MCM1116511.1 indole-3-glycerol phosphate synthase TrpC [Pseudoflavonifractor sp.]